MKQTGQPDSSPVPKRHPSGSQLNQGSDTRSSHRQTGDSVESDGQMGEDLANEVDSFGQLKIAKT